MFQECLISYLPCKNIFLALPLSGMFVAISSMSFLIPPTAYPARLGMLLTTLLVKIYQSSIFRTIKILINLYYDQGSCEHVHLGSVEHAIRLERSDRTGPLDPLHHPLGVPRPHPLHRPPDQHEAGDK